MSQFKTFIYSDMNYESSHRSMLVQDSVKLASLDKESYEFKKLARQIMLVVSEKFVSLHEFDKATDKYLRLTLSNNKYCSEWLNKNNIGSVYSFIAKANVETGIDIGTLTHMKMYDVIKIIEAAKTNK